MKKDGKLSIAFLYDDSLDKTDGVAQQVKAIGGWLSANGHRVTYLVGETKMEQWAGGRVYSLSRNINVSFNGNQLSMPLLASKRRIKKVLAEEKFDVLHVQTPYSPLLASRVIVSVPASTAVVGTFHIFPAGRLAYWGGKVLSAMTLRSRQRFDEMVSVSPPAASFAKQAFHFESQVIPNTVDVSRFQTKQLRQAGTEQVVFLGRLVERKGAKYLIEAFSKLSSVDAKLIIAGSGPELGRLQGLVRRLGLGNKVEFPGFISEADKPSLLARADIACFPSLGGESFGVVLIEAMAAGAKVVLGGNNPGYQSVLGGRPDQLVNPADTTDFAKRLDAYLTDQAKIDAATAWQSAQLKNYDVNTVGAKLVKVYRQAIDKRTASRA